MFVGFVEEMAQVVFTDARIHRHAISMWVLLKTTGPVFEGCYGCTILLLAISMWMHFWTTALVTLKVVWDA